MLSTVTQEQGAIEMNNAFKLGLLAAAMGGAMVAERADAAVVVHNFYGSAVNYCQAFTPGPANTVRNRVIGAENVGGTAIAVACNFHAMQNNSAGTEVPHELAISFSNLNTSGTVEVTCTLLTDYYPFVSYTVAKTTPALAANGGTAILSWTASDNPSPGATNLGNNFLGVNCTLPPGAIISGTALRWRQDNGI
jgi:hypothetical protein